MSDAEDREPEFVLELDEAVVVRGRARALDGVSLAIPVGTHTAVIGPNGSGKSTLVKLITGELYPLARPAGPPPVRIFGRDRWNLTELRSHLGIVSADLHQRFVRGSSMGRVTGLDAVVSGFLSSEVVFAHHSVTHEMRRAALDALDQVGGAGLAERTLNRMSTGEARRVLIARALAHQPRALVLDEPTTGLDLVARREFLRHLRDLARRGTTLVLVTHQIEELIPEIERVVLLSEGRISADGRPDEVLTAERMGAAYGSRLVVHRGPGGYELRFDESAVKWAGG